MDNKTQTNPNSHQNQQPADTSPFASPSQSVPPAQPFSQQNPSGQTKVQTETPPQTQSEPQAVETQETVVTAGNGGNKNKKLKIVGGLVAVLFLILGTVVGVIALRQNQSPQRSQAAACSDWCTSPQDCAAAGGIETNPCSFSSCSEGLVACTLETDSAVANTTEDTVCKVDYPGGVTGSIVISSGCSSIPFDVYYRSAEPGTTDGDCVGTNENSLGTKNLGPGTYNPRDFGPGGCGYCVQLDQADGGQGGSAQYTGDCPTPTPTAAPNQTPNPTPTGSATPTPTPTLPPGEQLSCMCLDIKIYDENWNQLSSPELSNLKPGDTINLAVAQNSSDDGITKARFIFNGTIRDSVTTRVPGKPNEFYDQVIIPEPVEGESTLGISVNAQLYHPEIGWF